MKRIVNGIEVEMDSQEIEALEATRPTVPQKLKSQIDSLTERLIQKGILTEADASIEVKK